MKCQGLHTSFWSFFNFIQEKWWVETICS